MLLVMAEGLRSVRMRKSPICHVMAVPAPVDLVEGPWINVYEISMMQTKRLII